MFGWFGDSLSWLLLLEEESMVDCQTGRMRGVDRCLGIDEKFVEKIDNAPR